MTSDFHYILNLLSNIHIIQFKEEITCEGIWLSLLQCFSSFQLFSSFLSAQKSSIPAGIVQFTEGETFMDGNPLQLTDGVRGMHAQTISTKQGRIELLFASNTHLSIGENASLRMEQSNSNGARWTLEKGSILIEVVRRLTDPIRVRILNSTVEIRKPGLYRLDSRSCDLRVYGGTALVDNGSKKSQVKREKEVRLDADLSQTNFDLKDSDALHQWSAHRSFDIFLANPETNNWKQRGNPYFFENSNYRVRFETQVLPNHRPPRVPLPPPIGSPCTGDQCWSIGYPGQW